MLRENILDDEGIGIIQFGHSKDMRSDLKQVILSLLVTNDGGIPLIAKVLHGNTSDAKHFRKTLSELQKTVSGRGRDAPSTRFRKECDTYMH